MDGDPGVGGGLIRDGPFIQQGPPAVTSDSRYLLVILLAGCVAFLLRDRVIGLNKVIAWFETLGVRAHFMQERVARFNLVSDVGGLLKEELDALTQGTGFSFGDLAADRAGLWFEPESLRRLKLKDEDLND